MVSYRRLGPGVEWQQQQQQQRGGDGCDEEQEQQSAGAVARRGVEGGGVGGVGGGGGREGEGNLDGVRVGLGHRFAAAWVRVRAAFGDG